MHSYIHINTLNIYKGAGSADLFSDPLFDFKSRNDSSTSGTVLGMSKPKNTSNTFDAQNDADAAGSRHTYTSMHTYMHTYMLMRSYKCTYTITTIILYHAMLIRYTKQARYQPGGISGNSPPTSMYGGFNKNASNSSVGSTNSK